MEKGKAAIQALYGVVTPLVVLVKSVMVVVVVVVMENVFREINNGKTTKPPDPMQTNTTGYINLASPSLPPHTLL